jgi:ABC-type phosphate transport system ATPase subunit
MIAGLSSRNFVLFEDERILPIEQIEELQLFYVARLPQQVQRISETLTFSCTGCLIILLTTVKTLHRPLYRDYRTNGGEVGMKRDGVQ